MGNSCVRGWSHAKGSAQAPRAASGGTPDFGGKPPKERPFFVSITENVPFARVLSSNTECAL